MDAETEMGPLSNFKQLPDSIQKLIAKYEDPASMSSNRGVKVSGGA